MLRSQIVMLIVLFAYSLPQTEVWAESSKNDLSSFKGPSAETTEDAQVDDVMEWRRDDLAALNLQYIDTHLCTIPRFDNLSEEQFYNDFYDKHPVIVRYSGGRNAEAQRITMKGELLELYGDKEIILSSANTFSYDKRTTNLASYIEQHMAPWSLDRTADSSFYHFGDNKHSEWSEVFDAYEVPAFLHDRSTGSFSFGLGGSGSGVPFHVHGPVYAEVLHGKKRWFLYPPSATPQFEPDVTTLRWTKEVYSTLNEQERPLECVCGPNEFIYIPHSWWHATLNIHEAVFMSTFI